MKKQNLMLLLVCLAIGFMTTQGVYSSQPTIHIKTRAGLMNNVQINPNPSSRIVFVSSGYFSPPTIITNTANLEAITMIDLNSNAQMDVTMAASFDFDGSLENTIQLLPQSGGGLVYGTTQSSGDTPVAIAAGDLNGDGQPDVIVANNNDDTAGLFLGNGTDLDPMITLPTGSSPDGVAIGDFNSDLLNDVAITHAVSQTIAIYLQKSNGNLDSPIHLPLSSSGFNDVSAGDINGDGLDDLVVLRGAGHVNDQVAILLQQNGSLSSPIYRTVPDGGFLPHGLAVGDVSGDGREDIIVTSGGNIPQAYLSVFVQESGGGLPISPTVYSTYHIPESVEIGDINHDGLNDVILVHTGWRTLATFLQNGSGGLDAYLSDTIPYTDLYRPDALALGDISGDGCVDALIVNQNVSHPTDNGLVILSSVASCTAPTSMITTSSQKIDYRGCGQPFAINGTVTSDTSLLELSFDGGRTWQAIPTLSSWSYNWTAPTTDGVISILSKATNGMGKVQYPLSQTKLLIDCTVPPLSAPILAAPACNSWTQDNTPIFDWSNILEANSYQIMIDNDSSFVSPEIDISTLNESIYTHSTALSDGSYYWRVRANDGTGKWGLWSKVCMLNIDTTPPEPPSSLSPICGSVTNREKLRLDWADDNSIAKFHIQISLTPEFSTLLHDESNLSTSDFEITPSKSGSTYFWRVRGQDHAGQWSTWEECSFKTVSNETFIPRPIHPMCNSTNRDSTPSFEWSASANVTEYQIMIDVSSDYENPIIDISSLVNSAYRSTDSLPDGIYHWRVRAKNMAGIWGPWSSDCAVIIQTHLSIYLPLINIGE